MYIRHLDAIEREAFELEPATAYKANSELNQALANEFRFVDPQRFRSFYGTLSAETMVAVSKAVRISLGL